VVFRIISSVTFGCAVLGYFLISVLLPKVLVDQSTAMSTSLGIASPAFMVTIGEGHAPMALALRSVGARKCQVGLGLAIPGQDLQSLQIALPISLFDRVTKTRNPTPLPTLRRRSWGGRPANPRMSDVGCTVQELMVCTTRRWREMDSNHRFRAITSFVSRPPRTDALADFTQPMLRVLRVATEYRRY
jgi:hypothetical protein